MTEPCEDQFVKEKLMFHSASGPRERKGGKGIVECSKVKTEGWLREKRERIDSERDGS